MNRDKLKSIAVLCFLLLPLTASAKHKHKEKWYQEKWCAREGGKVEHVLPDRTRVDCLTKSHAIEFDFGDKWAESIGQALYYAIQTGKKPGVAVILEEPKDYKYFVRLNSIIEYYKLPVKVWKISEDCLK